MFSDKIISYIYGSIKHVDVPSIELKRKEKYRSQETEKKESWFYILNIEEIEKKGEKIEKKGEAWFHIPSIEVKKLKKKGED